MQVDMVLEYLYGNIDRYIPNVFLRKFTDFVHLIVDTLAHCFN